MSDGESTETAPVRGAVTAHEPTRAQQLVVRRIAEARATIPDLTVALTIDITDAVTLVAGPPPAPGLNDMVVAACARALREHPTVNGAYRDGRAETYGNVNIGFAVEAQDSLIVPTLFGADELTLDELATRRMQLTQRAVDGTITAPETGGQTFTVLSVTGAGAVAVTPIVAPLQAAALAIGAPSPRVVAGDDGPVVRAVLDATLACDHRAVLPHAAARFLTSVQALLEAPASWVT